MIEGQISTSCNRTLTCAVPVTVTFDDDTTETGTLMGAYTCLHALTSNTIRRTIVAMRASWNDVVLAESADTIEVEGNHYFPANSLVSAYFKASEKHSVCPWKGKAHYYDIVVGDACNEAAAWYYPKTLPKADHFCGRVAFWKGVIVQ